MGYHPTLEEAIFEFQRIAYPRRRADWIPPRWRWMFLESAARLGVAPMVWLYRGPGGIAGHQGAIPVRLKVDAAEYLTGWFVETMVLEAVRGKAVGPALVARARRDLPFNLSLGQTPQMRALQCSLGWRQVCPLPAYSLVLDARATLEGKVPVWLRPAAAAALAAMQRLRRFRGRRRLSWLPEVREIGRFGPDHDALWASAAREYRCAVVRDSSYLNWKYVDQPGQHFLRLEVRREGTAAGVVVLAVIDPDAAYRYRRALLIDMVVAPGDVDAVWAILDAARRAARARGAALLAIDLIHPVLTARVLEFGFSAREPKRFLLVSADGIDEGVSRTVMDPEAWLITRGDSDIDRPW